MSDSTGFVYVVRDTVSGWSKVGLSSTPYSRIHQLRRDYPELAHAEFVGLVRCSRPDGVELRILNSLYCLASHGRFEVCGERFRETATTGEYDIFEMTIVWARLLGVYENSWSVLPRKLQMPVGNVVECGGRTAA